MRIDPLFSERVSQFNARVAHWRQHLDQLQMNAPLVVEELETAAEELRATTEELEQQNRELSETRNLLETECSRYRDFFDLAPAAYFVTDRRGVVLEANRAGAKIVGIPSEYLPGRSLLRFVHRDDVPMLKRHIAALLETHAPARCAVRFVSHSGDENPVVLGLTAMADAEGCTEKCTGIRWVITEPVEVESTRRELQHLQKEFSALRASFDTELADLRHALLVERSARLRAEETSHAKDQFFAMVCHELRNSVSPAQMILEALMGSGSLPPQHHEMLEMIRRSLHSQQRLISDLLDVNRMVHDKLELQRQVLVLPRLLEEVVHAAMPEAQAKSLTMRLVSAVKEGTELEVYADDLRLRQVFSNILQNAIKFTPEGGSVTVRRARSSAGRDAVVEIQDSGRGIRPEELTRIFQPFAQSGNSVNRGGLGLGLAIARGLIHAHGGEIEAESDGPGKGATFTIRMPLATAKSSSNAVPPSHCLS